MLTRRWKWQQSTWGELLAEFVGTFVLICFGDGVVAMAVAALNQSGRGTAIFVASGDWLLITWGWAMAVTFGVYVAGGVSGFRAGFCWPPSGVKPARREARILKQRLADPWGACSTTAR